MQYKPLDKSVFRFTRDAEKFLNALTTNEVSKPINAFLDKFGKLIVLADQLQQQDEIYLAIPNQYEQQFLQHLQPYLRLSKTRVEKTNLKAAQIIHIIPGKNDEKISNVIIPQNIGYISLLENLQAIKHLQQLSDEEYQKIRIENNIPLQGIDFHNEMFLECNIPEAISYTKGCYLGQEIIARVHHKSKPVKILTRILYQQLPENNLVTSQDQEIGKITSSCYSEKHKSFLCFAMIKNQDAKIDGGKRKAREKLK